MMEAILPSCVVAYSLLLGEAWLEEEGRRIQVGVDDSQDMASYYCCCCLEMADLGQSSQSIRGYVLLET